MTNDKAAAKILVADDEIVNIRLAKAMLSAEDWQIIEARDGQEALDKVHLVWPDVVVMDISMPRLGGLEALQKLKCDPVTAAIPVLMASGNTDYATRQTAFQRGAEDFLSKPYSKAEFVARIRSLLKVSAYNREELNFEQEMMAETSKKTAALNWMLSQLRAATLDSVLYLCQAAESRDEDPGHVRRVTFFAHCLATSLGLKAGELDALLYSVPMHDIGKIRTPDSILLKPGKLDAQEWGIARRHTEDFHFQEDEMTNYVKSGEVVAASHHEHWDGSGYPKGLKGEDIPLIGRITAVADAFDSMTSARPYRPGEMSADEAFAAIGRGSGSQFDPSVVAALLSSRQKILSIREQYRQEHGLDRPNSGNS